MTPAQCNASLTDRIVELIQERARLWRDQEMTAIRAAQLSVSSLFRAKATECDEILILIAGELAAEQRGGGL